MQKFDVIIGNPPYQDSGAFKGSSILWPKFFEKANELANDKSIISLVHPYTWTGSLFKESRSSKPLLDLLKNSKLLEINLTANEHFNVGSSTICYVCIVKGEIQNTPIKVIYQNTKIEIENIKKYPFIPQKINSNLDISILEKTIFNNLEKIEVISGGNHRKTQFNQNETQILKYPQAYTWANFKKNKYLYASEKGILQNEKKVIGFYSSNCEFIYDDGKFGLGEMTFGVKVENKTQGENLISILNSKLFNYISQFRPYSGTHGGRPATLRFLPKMDLDVKWTDKELYEYFNLNQEEIDLIESTIKKIDK